MNFKLFIFTFTILYGGFSFAQTSEEGSFKERRAQACQYLQEIENGVLVVRLTSNAKKIGQLELLKKGKGLSKSAGKNMLKN